MAKRTIRSSVFETNSSSNHAFVIKKPTSNDYYTTEEIEESARLFEGVITFYDLHFGRSPFMALSDFRGKLEYAFANLVNKYGDEYYKQLEDICLEVVPGFKSFEFDRYCDMKRAITGKNDPKPDDWDYESAKTEEQMIEYLNENYPVADGDEEMLEFWTDDDERYWRFDYYDFGSTDDYMLKGWLEKTGVTLREFLLNRRYVVICDGDEYCIWSGLKGSGLVNMDVIEREV